MRTVLVLGLLLVVTACLEQMPLPSVEESVRPDFSPDTTYLPLSPSWGTADGLITPIEVVVSNARQVFVADAGARDILVFNQAGTRLDQFDTTYATLDFDHLGSDFTPRDMDMDGRLNLLIIDGSNKIYRWNQYWNIHGIDSVASEILVKNVNTGERHWLSPFQLATAEYLQSPDWFADLDSSRYEKNAAMVDSLLKPHVFFDMDFWVNQLLDIYYQPEKTVFSAISGARLDDYFFYAADSMQNRILRAGLVRNGAVKLGDGDAYFTHFALFVDNVKEIGTGEGTVHRPTGLDVDNFGNLYWSQYGKYMYVHAVQPNKQLSFPTRFNIFVDDIMTPEQYFRPTDVAVDARQMIYVTNTDNQEVLVFNGDGTFFKKAGIEKMAVDTTMWVSFQGQGTLLDTSLWVYFDSDSAQVDTTIFIPGIMDSALVDTFYYRELKTQLIEPVSVAADERGVIYVCDPAQNGVFRFILSTSLDDEFSNINQ
jgi:DNA-binding beta-propeller fold protein YncE